MVRFSILIVDTNYISDGSDDIISSSSFKDAPNSPIEGTGITYKKEKELKLISNFLITLTNTFGINNINFRRIIRFIATNSL